MLGNKMAAVRRCSSRIGAALLRPSKQSPAAIDIHYNNGQSPSFPLQNNIYGLFYPRCGLFSSLKDSWISNTLPLSHNAKTSIYNFRNMYFSSLPNYKDASKVHNSNATKTGGEQQKSQTKVAFYFRSMQEKMKLEELPAAALGLGLAGAIPFVLLTPPFCSVLLEVLSTRPLEAQAAYGAVILSFLGGPHWGLAMVRTHAPPHDKVLNINISTFRFMWSVVPSLLAWPALLLSDIPKMTLMIFSFALVLGVDIWCSMQGLLPPWFLPLRVLLSVVVVMCLISSTLHIYFKNKAKPDRGVTEA